MEIPANDPRHQAARKIVREEFLAQAKEGVPYSFRAAIEGAYEGLVAVVIQRVWELQGWSPEKCPG